MNILCIGGANVDRKLRLLATPHPGSSNPAESSDHPGGVARNVADNLTRLGLPALLLTVTGDDDWGRQLLAGIDASAVKVLPGKRSDSYTAVLDPQGQLLIGLAAMPLVERLVPGLLPAALPSLTMFDLNLQPDTIAALLARSGESRLVAVAVSEPKMARLPDSLVGLHALLLNEGELAQTEGLASLHERGVQHIAVTLGASGVRLSSAGGEPVDLPALPVDIVDVTGAGDAFAAGVCAGLYRGDDWAAACRHGLALSAQVLQSISSTL
ncbi:PfkB family carbohydrate kinase [Burkholderiaceae bacterium UC74_6]